MVPCPLKNCFWSAFKSEFLLQEREKDWEKSEQFPYAYKINICFFLIKGYTQHCTSQIEEQQGLEETNCIVALQDLSKFKSFWIISM